MILYVTPNCAVGLGATKDWLPSLLSCHKQVTGTVLQNPPPAAGSQIPQNSPSAIATPAANYLGHCLQNELSTHCRISLFFGASTISDNQVIISCGSAQRVCRQEPQPQGMRLEREIQQAILTSLSLN
jgi:hypothetical protein